MDSPLVTITVQAAALGALSNILGQLIGCWQSNSPYSIDLADFTTFVVFTLLQCPPNVLWQAWLEAKFPGYTEQLSSLEQEELVDDVVSGGSSTGVDGKGSNLRRRVEKKSMTEGSSPPPSTDDGASESDAPKLNLRNTAIKFALDQTIGAGVNTVLFIVGIALLRGESLESIRAGLGQNFWPMIFAGQKLWPAVSILSFTVIPVERRMLFGSVVGLFWGAYLSLLSGTKD